MYNRYTPTPGGQYQRKPVPEPKRPPSRVAPVRRLRRSRRDRRRVLPRRPVRRAHRCGCRFWRG